MNSIFPNLLRTIREMFGVSFAVFRNQQSHRLIGNSKYSTGSSKIPKLEAGCSNDLLEKFDVFIFDCDGVIWKGDVAVEGAAEVLRRLRSLNKLIFFVTNNSTKSRKGFLSKFTSLGIEVLPQEILSSSFAAAVYFQQNPLPAGKKVYVVGEGGIGEELGLIGVESIGGLEDKDKVVNLGAGVKIDHDPDVGAVVVGYDRYINYYKIQYAQLCINQNKDCKFVATNMDRLSHMTDVQEWAAGGTMVGAIRGCTGKEPIVVGKPSALLIDYIIENHHVKRNRVCMVGDRLDTDILFGSRNGLKTILTLSGVTSEKTLFSPNNEIIPDYYANSIADILSVSA